MSASGSARDRVRATPFDTALNAEAAATHKPVKLKATTFFGGDLPVPAARLDENKQLVTDRAFKPDTANAYIIDWASKVPFRQGGFRETGSSSRKSAGLVGSLPSKNRAAVDFLVDERFAEAVAKDPQYLIDGSGALPELRKTLADTCREEWPTMKDAVRAKFTALASGDRVRYNTELEAFKTANPSYATPRQKRAKATTEQTAGAEARSQARVSAARRASNSLSTSKKADPSYLAQSAGGKSGGPSGDALRRSLRDVAKKTGPTEVRHVAAASPEPATATAAVAGKPQGNKRKAPAPLERQTESAAGGSGGTAAGKSTDKLPVSPSKTQSKAAVTATRRTDNKGSAAPDSNSAPASEGAKAGTVSSKGGGGGGLNVGGGSKEGGGLGQAKGNKRKLQAPRGGEETSVGAAVAPQSTLQQESTLKVSKKTSKAAPTPIRSQPSRTAPPAKSPAPFIPTSPPSNPIAHATSVALPPPAVAAPPTEAAVAVPSQVVAAKQTRGRGSAATAAPPKVKRVTGARTAPPPAPAVVEEAVVVVVAEEEESAEGVPAVKRRKGAARRNAV